MTKLTYAKKLRKKKKEIWHTHQDYRSPECNDGTIVVFNCMDRKIFRSINLIAR